MAIVGFFVNSLWQNVTANEKLPDINIPVTAEISASDIPADILPNHLPTSAETPPASVIVNDPVAEPTLPPTQNDPPQTSRQTVGTGVPVRLRIPSLGVNAVIEQVGITSDGAMAVPKDPQQAGWFALGTVPGEIGSAVIAGHVDWWYGTTGIFENLDKLKPGDILSIEDDLGQISNFVVKASQTYPPTANTTEIFSSTDAQAHLNLITCSGAWDKTAQQYSERLVVFTDLY